MIDIFTATSINAKIGPSKGEYPSFSSLSTNDLLKIRESERNKYETIIVGANTIKNDNPLLLNQLNENIRIIIDRYHDLDLDYKIFKQKPERTFVIVIGEDLSYIERIVNIGANVLTLSNKSKDKDILDNIIKIKHGNALVEGGGKTLSFFLNLKAINNIKTITFPIVLPNYCTDFFSLIEVYYSLELINSKIIDRNYLFTEYHVKY